MKKFLVASVFGLLIVGIVPLAHGSGFLIYEHGAAAQAMGGAFVAIANDPTAIFHNPAGMAWLKGTQLSVGGTFIFPGGSVSFLNAPYRGLEVKQASQTFFVPNFYLTHRFSDKLSAGLGFFAPYGLGTSWTNPKTFPLRYIGTKSDMETFFVNPALAYKLSDNFAIGVGASYIHSTLSLDLVRLVSIDHPIYGHLWAGDVPASLSGAKGDAFGVNAGALYRGSGFSLGFNWRSGFKINYKGSGTFDLVNVPAPLKAFLPTAGDVATTFHFPNIFGVGLAVDVTKKLLASADIHYVAWSTYKSYTINITYSGVPGSEEELVTEDWKDSILLRGGLQYQLSDALALRLGALWDQTPQPSQSVDPNLPDANRVAITGGFGYKVGHFTIDGTAHYEIFGDRTSPHRWPLPGYNPWEGTYKLSAWLFGFSLGYVF